MLFSYLQFDVFVLVVLVYAKFLQIETFTLLSIFQLNTKLNIIFIFREKPANRSTQKRKIKAIGVEIMIDK